MAAVMWQPQVGQQCRAVGPESGRRCTLEAGHDGDHEWVCYVRWQGVPALGRPDVWDRKSWPQTT